MGGDGGDTFFMILDLELLKIHISDSKERNFEDANYIKLEFRFEIFKGGIFKSKRYQGEKHWACR